MCMIWMIPAIVEFAEPSEARTAFKRLAYSKFKHLPLYLEWAPDCSLMSVDELKVKQENQGDEREKEVKPVKQEEDEDMVPEPETALFVKNLNFESTEADLKKVKLKKNVRTIIK